MGIIRPMSTILQKEIETFDKIKDVLFEHHLGKFVVIYGDDFIGSFDTFDAAAKEAIKKFGKGPYLIRKVGSKPPTLPASLALRLSYATN